MKIVFDSEEEKEQFLQACDELQNLLHEETHFFHSPFVGVLCGLRTSEILHPQTSILEVKKPA